MNVIRISRDGSAVIVLRAFRCTIVSAWNMCRLSVYHHCSTVCWYGIRYLILHFLFSKLSKPPPTPNAMETKHSSKLEGLKTIKRGQLYTSLSKEAVQRTWGSEKRKAR